MAITSGYFNSVNGDRKYNADQMSEYFEGIINEGVCQHIGGGLAVTAGTGLTVSVATGKAFIGQKWIKNDAALTLTITTAADQARIDAVVLRRNTTNRICEIAVKTGTPSASPSAPAMTRTSTTYEMALAYVNVAAGATSVTVTDKRADTTVCGWATVAQETSGEVDAQLNALKTGFDGVGYPSPVEMVQGEDEKLQNEIDFANNEIFSVVDITNVESKIITTNINIGSTVDITGASSLNNKSQVILCKKGQTFIITGRGLNEARLWAFTDSTYKLISKSGAAEEVSNKVLIAPADGYLIVNFYYTVPYDVKTYFSNIGDLDDLYTPAKNDVVSAINSVSKVQLFGDPETGWSDKGYMFTDGSYNTTNTSYKYIEKSVTPGQKIKFSSYNVGNIASLIYLNGSTVVSYKYYNTSTQYTNVVEVVPANTNKVVINTNINGQYSLYIAESSFIVDNVEALNDAVDSVLQITEAYKSIKLNCLGDSFTAPSNAWHLYVHNDLGCTMINCGEAGTAMVAGDDSFYNRLGDLDLTADGTIIFGGFNDAASLRMGVITLGNINSTHDGTTFYGGVMRLLDAIMSSTYMQGKLIIGVIPCDFNETAQQNLPDIQVALREIYSAYSIPYVDLKKDCQEMFLWYPDGSQCTYNYNTYRYGNGNTHPSVAGQKAIAKCIIERGIKMIFPRL